MSAHLEHLSDARAALIAGDVEQCTEKVTAFEALCEADPPDSQTLSDCRDRLAALTAIAAASAEGVAVARAGLLDAMAAAGRLTTYDSAGARESRQTRPSVTRRY